MRLLLLTTTLRRGGTERQVRLLAQGLRERGHAVEVGCLEPEGPLAAELRAAGVSARGLGARSRLDLLRVTGRLRRWIRASRPDVVVSFLVHANGAAWLATRGLPSADRPRRIVSLRTATHSRPWLRTVDRRAARGAERVVCVSEAVRRYAEEQLGLAAASLTTIPNGVALPDEGVDVAELRAGWVCVSRLEPDKRVGEAIAAWRLLAAEPEGAPPLDVVGGGRLRAALEREAHGLPIRFRGEQPRVDVYLRAAHGFVLPLAPAEGCPNALLEAMAAGLPVVTTGAGGALDHVSHETTGLLAEPGDARALAAHIRALEQSATLRARLGAAGRSSVAETVALPRVIDRWEALLQAG